MSNLELWCESRLRGNLLDILLVLEVHLVELRGDE